jgi:hypothetical protein
MGIAGVPPRIKSNSDDLPDAAGVCYLQQYRKLKSSASCQTLTNHTALAFYDGRMLSAQSAAQLRRCMGCPPIAVNEPLTKAAAATTRSIRNRRAATGDGCDSEPPQTAAGDGSDRKSRRSSFQLATLPKLTANGARCGCEPTSMQRHVAAPAGTGTPVRSACYDAERVSGESRGAAVEHKHDKTSVDAKTSGYMIYQQPETVPKAIRWRSTQRGDADMPLRLDCTRTRTWDRRSLFTNGLFTNGPCANGSKSFPSATAEPCPNGANPSLPQTDPPA